MHDRTAWTRGTTGPHKIKNKTYNNLVQFTRKCASCENTFSIFVTPKIADGHADSNSFGLKNCAEHRRQSIPRAGDETELATLRMANKVMKQELDGLYERLAQYELPAAMRNHAAQTKMPWE